MLQQVVEFNCDEPFASYLISGIKTVEGRVNKGKWKTLNIGDVLMLKTGDIVTKFMVRDLTYANTFEDLYQELGANLLPDLPQSAWYSTYSKFFTKEEETKYGVVGIHLSKLL